MNVKLFLGISLVIILRMFAAPAPVAHANPGDVRCFPDTGQCISGPIRVFWELHGGALVFGLPISPPQQEFIDGQPVTVQWFERTRFEHRNDSVMLGRVGVDLLWSYGIDWWTLAQGQPQEGCLFFAATRHSLCEPFLSHWLSHGANMAVFGQPVSEPRWELHGGANASVRLVQWFERARFELVGGVVVVAELGTELIGRQVASSPALQPDLVTASIQDAVLAAEVTGYIPITYPGHISAFHPLRTGGQDLFNCDDFHTWDDAWAFYQVNFPGDPNRLDEDNDGIPCEDLPGAP